MAPGNKAGALTSGRRNLAPNARSEAAGLLMLELAIVLVVAGLILALGASVLPSFNEAGMLARSRQELGEATSAVLNFAATNHRLPCPSDPALTFGDPGFGVEDCGRIAGVVPFESLLADEPFIDAAHRPVLYAVYRNAAIDADLAAVSNLEDGIDEPLPVINARDFCKAVRNGDPTSGTAFVATSTEILTGVGGCLPATLVNQAFVLTSAGIADSDGDTLPLDGYNADATPLCFASPEQGRSALYDDLVAAVGFSTLFGEICL